MSCILRHRGVKLILAYRWAKPAILAAGKVRGGMFLFLLFLHFNSFSSSPLFLSFIFSTISFISLLLFSGRRHKKTHKGRRVVKPPHNPSNLSGRELFDRTSYLLTCVPNKDSNQPAHARNRINCFAVLMKKLCTVGYPNTLSEDSDQTARMRRLI